jgi:hypothetical protein
MNLALMLPVLLTGKKASDSLLTGLLGYWKLDEAGGNAIDALGLHTLTDVGTSLGIVGKIGNARQCLSASSQYLTNAAFVLPDADFTIALWMNITTLTDFRNIVNKLASWEKGQLCIYIYSNKITFDLCTDASPNLGTVTSSTFGNLSTGTWYFMLADRNKITGKIGIEINGTRNEADAVGVMGTAGLFRLGARESSSPASFTNATVDECGVWGRLLTTAEKARLYNNS